MKHYYDRNYFMAGHVLSEYYKYCQGHLQEQEGVKEKMQFFLILTNWEQHPYCL